MPINTTNITDATNILGMIQGVNEITSGTYALLGLFVLFILMFLVFKNYDTKTVFLTNSFALTLISVIFWRVELIPMWALMFPIVMLIASIIMKLFSN